MHELEPVDRAKHRLRRAVLATRMLELRGNAEVEIPEPVAALHESDAMGKARSHVRAAKDPGQELGQLVGPVTELARRSTIQETELLVAEPDGRDTARGGTDDRLRTRKPFEVTRPEAFRLAPRTRGDERLPAAGLVGVVADVAARPLEHVDRRESDPGCELIDVAGDEERDVHSEALGA